MKNRILSYIASSAAALFAFAALISVGTTSMFGVYQPKVPGKLLK